MSLVSYADSDDSGDSDSSEQNVQLPTSIIKEDGRESDTKTDHLRNLFPKNDEQPEDSDGNYETTRPRSIGNLFSSLPAPWMSTLSWVNKDKSKKSGKKDKSHTVKITLPVAEEVL